MCGVFNYILYIWSFLYVICFDSQSYYLDITEVQAISFDNQDITNLLCSIIYNELLSYYI
jgi:hypothetical protein